MYMFVGVTVRECVASVSYHLLRCNKQTINHMCMVAASMVLSFYL